MVFSRVGLLLGVTLLSGTVLAASGSGTATVQAFGDPTIVNDQDLHFGQISNASGSSCTMNVAGAVSGGCIDPGSQAQVGQFTISSLPASVPVLLTLTGGNSGGGEVTFVAAGRAADGTTTMNLTNATQSSAFTTTAVPADIVVTVHGDITVNSPLSAGVSYSATYTLDVIYQ